MMPETIMPELKPCPDGHKTVSVVEWPAIKGEWRFFGFCTCCAWRGPSGDTPERAATAWNTRAPADTALVEALEKAWALAATMRNASKLIGPYPNDRKANSIWAKGLYHEGRKLQEILKPARAAPLETTADISNSTYAAFIVERGDQLRTLVELAHQYLSDLRYPPSPDSKERRIERIEAVLREVQL